MSNWKGAILLLILLVAGWLIYRFDEKKLISANKTIPGNIPMRGKLTTITGTVLKYGSNHGGDIDRFMLASDQKNIWIHFPPHTARLVTSFAVVNNLIEAVVDPNSPPGHESGQVFELKHLHSVSAKTDLDMALIPAPAPRKGFEIEIKGSLAKEYKHGNAPGNTFILSGKLVSLPPHMARELFPLMSNAKSILVRGYMRDSTEGFLSASGLSIVKAGSIQIDSIIYKIR